MKYFNFVEPMQREEILRKFNIKINYDALPSEMSDEEVFEIAFELCKRYLPEEIKKFVRQNKKNEMKKIVIKKKLTIKKRVKKDRWLKDNLKEYIGLMSYVKRNWQDEALSNSNEMGLKSMGDLINENSEKSIGHKQVLGPMYSSHLLRKPMELLLDEIQQKFDIEIIEVISKSPKKLFKKQLNIPVLLEPFIYFVTWMESHLFDAYRHRDDFYNIIFKLFCDVLDTYTLQQKLVGIYLFQREYCLDIGDVVEKSSNEHGDLSEELLKILFNTKYLLPFVELRTLYFEKVRSNISREYRARGIFGNSSSNVSFLFEKGDFEDLPQWLEKINTAMLQFMLIYIPLVEQCFYALCEKIINLSGESLFNAEKYIDHYSILNIERENESTENLSEISESDVKESRVFELTTNYFISGFIRDFALTNFISRFPPRTSRDEMKKIMHLHVEIYDFLEDAKSNFYK
ncbi:hypothetical protein OM416_27725 [Paenibacillus sp. LS1]|uniref:hypothetical protein n=1 Tax=Paenibacillus sp. LS1 TaxID=2992120 RepID=UPI00222ECF8A|nr:hypothetical protein [Paenibacillus sp. LS1]MCW3795402.1 hypothetical protein [Paenibacillus sp. LS1]